MGHGGRMADQALNAAQAFCQLEQLCGSSKSTCRFCRVVFETKGNNAAKSFGLLFGHLMVWMRCKTGIIHFVYCGMLFQEFCYFLSRCAMLAQAQVQGFYAAYHQPAVKGAEDGATGILDEFNAVAQ